MAESGVDVSIERKDEPAPADGKRHPNTCPSCGSHYRDEELRAALRVCSQCGHHFPMPARERIDYLADPGSFEEEAADVRSADPLEFFDLRPYRERLAEAERADGTRRGDRHRPGDARPARLRALCHGLLVPRRLDGQRRRREARPRLRERCGATGAAHLRYGVGGARMQEGILSLMQLPKTVCAVEDLHEAGGALISVMAHPTTAGVLASFASLGDVIVAEPKALLSFTGPRVVQQTTREKLPTTSASPSRTTATGTWTRSCRVPSCGRTWRACCGCSRASRVTADEQVRLRERLAKLRRLSLLGGTRVSGDLERLEEQLERMQAEVTDEEIWRSVELARHPDRPYTLDYVERLLDDFVELHGDRGRADDQALVTGIGRFGSRTVALVGHQKGRDLKERTQRNFGMAYPEGYRKAMRVMELADGTTSRC